MRWLCASNFGPDRFNRHSLLSFAFKRHPGSFQRTPGPLKRPRCPLKGPRSPLKGPRGPFKGPRVPLKDPGILLKDPGVLLKDFEPPAKLKKRVTFEAVGTEIRSTQLQIMYPMSVTMLPLEWTSSRPSGAGRYGSQVLLKEPGVL